MIKKFVSQLSKLGLDVDETIVREMYDKLDPHIKENAKMILLPVAAAAGTVYAMDNETGEPVGFDFTRSSSATYFDVDNNLHEILANMPRIDYGNYSKEAKLLVEKAGTNIIPISAIVADSAIVSNIYDEKYGNVKSFKETGDNNFHRLRWVYSSSVIKEQSAFSILLKYDGRQHIVLRLLSGSNSAFDYVVVDLLNKVITKHLHPYSNAYLQVLDDDWIRLIYIQESNPYDAYNTFILNSAISADSNSNPIFEGDPEKGFLYATPQFELDSIQPTSYIPTTGTAVTRSADLLKLNLDKLYTVQIKTVNNGLISFVVLGEINVHDYIPTSDGVEYLATIDNMSVLNNFIDHVVADGGIVDVKALAESYNNLSDEDKLSDTIIIPGAYKEGFVYGIEKGSSFIKLPFGRASSATLFDKELNLQIVDSDIPRIDYGNYSNNAKLLIEKTSTNLVQASEIISFSVNIHGWTMIVPPVDNPKRQLSSFIEKGIWTVEVRNGGDISLYNVSFNLGVGKNMSFNTPYTISFSHTTSTPRTVRAYVCANDLTNMLLTTDYFQTTTEWQDFAATIQSSSDVNIDRDRTGFYMTSPRLENEYTQLRLLQIEQGNQKTSYISTTGSTVTRSADLLQINLESECTVKLNTTKQNAVLSKQSGTWNIHEDLNNEGIHSILIKNN